MTEPCQELSAAHSSARRWMQATWTITVRVLGGNVGVELEQNLDDPIVSPAARKLRVSVFSRQQSIRVTAVLVRGQATSWPRGATG